MFSEWINSISTFLNADVKDKKETKELAVLIRLTCLIFAVYFFIVGISIAILQHYYLALFLLIAIGLLVGAFICTYENHTRLGLIILNGILIVFPSLLAFFVGFEMDFHIATFLNILIVYFNKSDKMMFKRMYTLVLCTYLMCLTQFCDSYPNMVVPNGFPRIFIQSLNVLVFSCTLGSTAYSYCMKFNQAEEKLRRINDNLEKMANLDTLTGLSNRRHMNEYLDGLVFNYNKSGKTFTIAIGDIDFFKKVNDTYGHDTGDFVLSSTAARFTEFMKDKGHVARWGGEEFLFAFENMNLQEAAVQMNEMRKIIESSPINFKDFHFNITMTYGMEEYNDMLGVEAAINRADNKLYKGKTSGRNQVVI